MREDTMKSPIAGVIAAHRTAFDQVTAARAEVDRLDPWRESTRAVVYDEYARTAANSPEWRAACERLDELSEAEAERFAALVAVAKMLAPAALVELLRYACLLSALSEVTGYLVDDRGLLALLTWVLDDSLADNDDESSAPD